VDVAVALVLVRLVNSDPRCAQLGDRLLEIGDEEAERA